MSYLEALRESLADGADAFQEGKADAHAGRHQMPTYYRGTTLAKHWAAGHVQGMRDLEAATAD